MRTARLLRMLGLLAGFALGVALGAEDPALALKDLDGASREPLKFEKDQKAVVFVFITNDCPISNAYAPEINRICAAYAKQGVAFYLVHVDPDLKPETARKHAKEFGYTCPVLLDPQQALAVRVKAAVTPEAVVVSPEGKTLYRGRIDDRYISYTKQRAEPESRDLRAALDALCAGKPVPVAETKAVGCIIQTMKERKP
ncbi:MAG: redoxin family protein [Planctomycetes bacterium]|nr:redoxin family protein [Planctomycetota bacterium]